MSKDNINTVKNKRLTSLVKTLLAFLLGFLICFVPAMVYILNEIRKTLPDVSYLQSHRPAQPLRFFSASGELLAEFGEERREIVSIKDIPAHLKNAIISVEDANFYKHRGVDYSGILRAIIKNSIAQENAQGASTITMQVARNMFLSKEKSYTRKIAEIMLAFRIEEIFSKDDILEIYINEIFLGERSYGFSAAASTYFDKSLNELSLAECAVLAGLPKAPSSYNPVVNYTRAMVRKNHILGAMKELGYIDKYMYEDAISEEIKIFKKVNSIDPSVEFVVEDARKLVYEHLGEGAYTDGYDVVLTVDLTLQKAAQKELRSGLLNLQKLRGWEGVEAKLNINIEKIDKNIARKLLLSFPDSDELRAAVVVQVSDNGNVKAILRNGEYISISSDVSGYKVSDYTKKNVPNRYRIEKGAVVRVTRLSDGKWILNQRPRMEGAIVSVEVDSGKILALVGGFDFSINNFNHSTQALRQTGSTFKPFVYSAALDQGIFPGSIVNDSRRVVKPGQRGRPAWSPKNYANNYEGDITVRRAFIRSKNVATVNVMQAAGEDFVRNRAMEFGFDSSNNPPGLPLALGAGLTSPLHLTQAYSVFANSGKMLPTILIKKISQRQGNIVYEAPLISESRQVISAKNAFIVDSLLKDVVRNGTARKALALGREDVAGKTGTSNNAKDLWFSGYAGGIATTTWIGYDTPKSLGATTGGSVALPIWIKYMKTALIGKSEKIVSMPADVVYSNGDYVYEEFWGKKVCSGFVSLYVHSSYSCFSR